MNNIYFIEAGFSFDQDIYLPYSTGTIAAYLKAKGCFDEKFNFGGFIYRRERTDSIIEKIDNPYIVGFSCCIWNFRFNLEVAKKIKSKYPECKIVFGGHNVSSQKNLLKEYPFIDILIFGEGETIFYDILENSEKGRLIDTANIAFRRNGNIIFTNEEKPNDISDFPSPYTTGIFDSILEKEERSSLLCILETNRGCPYSCSYCDWCAGKKVRHFPMEKILSEIKWMSDNKIEYCFCADSNFGMFKRDIEIANALVSAKKAVGYPKIFRPCYAKESNDTVFTISSMLNEIGMDKGATMAYQTLSEDALSNINRKNLTLEHFSTLLKKYTKAGIPTYSELILGLPGETRTSFCEGICKILESGQHNSLSIYYLEMLPNSEMSQNSYIEKHKLNAIEVGFNHMHSKKTENEIEEYSHIVQSTKTLSKEDWVYCNLFSICVQSFHSLGFLRLIAIYLNQEKGVSYYKFYTELLEYIMTQKDTSLYKLFSLFNQKLLSSLSGDWNYRNPDFGDVTWTFEEGAYLEMLKNSTVTWDELDRFLKRFFDGDEKFSQLQKYQNAILRKCGSSEENHIFEYDFLTFFEEALQGKKTILKKEKAKYTFNAQINYTEWKSFAKEIVWYGRRRGDTLYSNRPGAKTAITKELF